MPSIPIKSAEDCGLLIRSRGPVCGRSLEAGMAWSAVSMLAHVQTLEQFEQLLRETQGLGKPHPLHLLVSAPLDAPCLCMQVLVSNVSRVDVLFVCE